MRLNPKFSSRHSTAIAALVLTIALPLSAQMVTHLAGSTAGGGASDGTGTDAHFGLLNGIATTAAGSIFVADAENDTIRKVSSSGKVTTFAGLAGARGYADGAGAGARFYGPECVAIDHSGNLYVTDTGNNVIRKITSDGLVSTLAGSPGVFGTADGKGNAATFGSLGGIGVDGNGLVYVADFGNLTIRKITPDGTVSTLAGSPGVRGFSEGTGAAAQFDEPLGLAVDPSGNIFVSDDAAIRKITPAGVVTLFAGSQLIQGDADGPGATATFSFPVFMSADTNGNIYVADQNDGIIREITQDAIVSTPVNNLSHPNGVAVDTLGTIYGADITGIFKAVAGSTSAVPFAGSNPVGAFAVGVGTDAQFNTPLGIVFDQNGDAFVSDLGNRVIREISPVGTVTVFAGQPGVPGTQDGTGSGATFFDPTGLAIDSHGNLFSTDQGFHTIREITPAGVVATIAGHPGVAGSTNATGTQALFRNPTGIAADSAGNVYVADSGNFTIRKITPDSVVTTFAGTTGVQGVADGVGTGASFNSIYGLAIDHAGKLYCTDVHNDGSEVIREITPDGNVTTLNPVNPDGSPHQFGYMTGIGVEADGTIVVGDGIFGVVDTITQAGVVRTMAGSGADGSTDGIGTQATFSIGLSMGLAIGPGGVYVTEQNGHSIRAIGPDLGDRAAIDNVGGQAGAARQLDTAPQNATAWDWSLFRQPTGSNAVLSATNVRNPTFTPDIPGRYVFQLVASNGSLKSVSTISLTVEAGRTRAINRP